MLPLSRIIGQDAIVLVNNYEFIGLLREYYDKDRVIFLI
jgi:hypothetical protein